MTHIYSHGTAKDHALHARHVRLLVVSVKAALRRASVAVVVLGVGAVSQFTPPTAWAMPNAAVDCGPVSAGAEGGTLDLIILTGGISCTEAQQILTDYRVAPGRQGSGGFVTIDGWDCGHNSIAGYEHSGQDATCQRGNVVFNTQASPPK